MSSAGISPKNPTKYVGPNVYVPVVISRNREPTSADYRQPETGKLYPINSFWIISKNPTNGMQGDLWYLSKIVSNTAFWVQLSAGTISPVLGINVPLGVSPINPNSFGLINFTSSGNTVEITGSSANPNNHTINFDITGGSVAIEKITGDDTIVVVPDSNGNINLNGLVVANSTHSKAVFTHSPSAHNENIEVQVSSKIASTDITKVGLSCFNQAIFDVDANGFVNIPTQQGVQYYDGIDTFSGIDGNTATYVLTSNGSGMTPSFQPATGGNPFQPNAVVQIFDDFINRSSFGITPTGGVYVWNITGFDLYSAMSNPSHPGVLAYISNGGSAGTVYLDLSTFAPFYIGGGVITINYIVNINILSSVSGRYILRTGMTNLSLLSDIINGFEFEYSDNINSGNWVYKTAASSVLTTVNSSIAVTSGWHNLQIEINAAASSISFSIDGVSAGSAITTNIPSTALMPFLVLIGTGIPQYCVGLDLFYYNQTLTTPR